MMDEPDDEEGPREAAIALMVFGVSFAFLGILSRNPLPFMVAETLLGLAIHLLLAG
jgi:hypothetical protein